MQTRKGIISILICFFFLLSSCTASIKRQGYNIDDYQASNIECDNIIIAKSVSYDPELVQIIGEISASDTGFSVKCSESFVIEYFRNEACIIGADIINITEDSQPDFSSTCYRAKAEFIKIKNRQMLAEIKSDPKYSAEKIKNRSQYSECMNNGIVTAGALGGLIGALILYSICNSNDTENDQTENKDVSLSDKNKKEDK